MEKDIDDKVVCIFDENAPCIDDKIVEIFKIYLETKEDVL